MIHLYTYIHTAQRRCRSQVDTGNDARVGTKRDKYISHDLFDSGLRANKTPALPFAEQAQMLHATISGIIDSAVPEKYPG